MARSLASADFDEDGTPDLVSGYATSSGGSIILRRGNVDAVYPNSNDAKARKMRGEFIDAPFFPESQSIAIPAAADFLGAGDFDADGHWDIVAARRGGDKLYWLRGDGKRDFTKPEVVTLSGTVTAFATGEMNRADGLTDLAVGIVNGGGAQALVFESPLGALRSAPESFTLPAAATSLTIGHLDDDYMADLAVAAGHDLIIVGGRDRKLSVSEEARGNVAEATVSSHSLQFNIAALGIGDFVGDSRQDLALLSDDGTLRVLEHVENESIVRSGKGGVNAVADGTKWLLSAGQEINVAKQSDYSLMSPSNSPKLLAAKVSSLPKSDLIVFGKTNNASVITTTDEQSFDADGNPKSAATRLTVAATLNASDEVTAVLPMRLSPGALSDLVITSKSAGAPAVVASDPSLVLVVDATTDTNDVNPGDGICKDSNNKCSYRAALVEANAQTNGATIHFNIPGGGVPQLIIPYQFTINKPVVLDATTQPGGRVEFIGINGNTNAITIRASNSVIRGFAWWENAVDVGGDNNIIEGNIVGLHADGSTPPVHTNTGILISSGSNDLVGGTTGSARNVVSFCGASDNPVITFGTGTGSGGQIQGNYIGTNLTGTASIGNLYIAISIRGSTPSGFTIGGTTAGAGNVVSANGFQEGLVNVPAIYDERPGSVIQGNLIGTDLSGTQLLGNGVGVELHNSVTLGGTTPAARNIISGSLSDGVRLITTTAAPVVVQGNYIGTNRAGTAALPNLGNGINMQAQGTTIGGTVAGARNIISGNGGDGILIQSNFWNSNNVIQGNYIGIDAGVDSATSSVKTIPNGGNGINLLTGTNNLVGGTDQGAGNWIGGNLQNGIQITTSDAASPVLVEGNTIGGYGFFGNKGNGVFMGDTNNFPQIGGTTPGAGNRIINNGLNGVAAVRVMPAVLSNSISGNGKLGIDRRNNGLSQNTNPPGGDNNFPLITSVQVSDTNFVINGTLKNAANKTYTLQFFANQACDPSGYGEGEGFIGQTNVTTNGNGDATFSANLPNVAGWPTPRYITATAVGPTNGGTVNTSEFSFCAAGATYYSPSGAPGFFDSITPNRGSASGITEVTILGRGLQQGTPLVLGRMEQSPADGSQTLIQLACTVTRISLDGTTLEGQCDPANYHGFAASAQGTWIVQDPNRGFLFNGEGLTFTFDPEIKDDFYVDIFGPDVIRPGGTPVTWGIIIGNRGNTLQPPSMVDVSLPPGVRFYSLETANWDQADPSAGTQKRIPYVELSKPESFGGSGESVLRFFIPENRAGTARTYALQLICRPEVQLGTDLPLTVEMDSSSVYTDVLNSPIDPNTQVTSTIIDNTPDHIKMTLQVTNPIDANANGSVDLEFTRSDAAAEAPFQVQFSTDAQNNYIMNASVAFANSPPKLSTLTAIFKGASNAGKPLSDALGKWSAVQSVSQSTLVDSGAIGYLGRHHILPQDQINDAAGFVDARVAVAAGSQLAPDGGEALKLMQQITNAAPGIKLQDLIRHDQDAQSKIPGYQYSWSSHDLMVHLAILDEHERWLAQQKMDRRYAKRKKKHLKAGGSLDPNFKAGAMGTGTPEHYLSTRENLAYEVGFENLPSAGLPAQEVVITDQLDPSKMDISTFALGTISFGKGFVVTPPPGLKSWATDVDMRPTRNIITRVIASLDQTNGIVRWHFFSLNPATMQPVTDPTAGFLPPNVNAPEGDGAVMFNVKPLASLTSGTQIFNQATIVFDANAPISTGQWVNTIDDSLPTSHVSPLPAQVTTTSFPVAWSGTDTGSGVETYTIYVSTNGGAFAPWLDVTEATTAVFYGESNTTYAFYSVAHDGAGNTEAAPAVADATTTTPTCGAITFSPLSLPSGTVASAYNQTLAASGGTNPFSFVITNGALPPGLMISANTGVISGAPTKAGDFGFTVTATDAKGCVGSQAYSLHIDCPSIVVGPSSLPGGTVGVSYSQTVSASGTSGPFNFAVTSGALPAGLSLNPSTGQISGSPTGAETANFTITATDAAAGCVGNRSYSVTITGPLPIIITEQGTNDVAAVDSVTYARSPFRVHNDHNFSADGFTRIIFFVANNGTDLTNLKTSAGGVELTVESVGVVAGIGGWSYVIVSLQNLQSISAPADLPLTITVGNVTTGAANLRIAP